MARDNEFIKIRDEFCAELEPKALKANIDCWNFYINSTAENMKTYETSQDIVYKLYQNVDLYKKLQELKKENLKYRGSSNQRIIDVQKSLKENKIIIYMD